MSFSVLVTTHNLLGPGDLRLQAGQVRAQLPQASLDVTVQELVEVPLLVTKMPSFAVLAAQLLVKSAVICDFMLWVPLTHDQVGLLGLLCQQI